MQPVATGIHNFIVTPVHGLYYYLVRFEWDPNKATINKRKHGISFKEAATVFGDSESMTFDDPDHSVEEDGFLTIGRSRTGQVLLVSHTDRVDAIRIISARKATTAEKDSYEEEK